MTYFKVVSGPPAECRNVVNRPRNSGGGERLFLSHIGTMLARTIPTPFTELARRRLRRRGQTERHAHGRHSGRHQFLLHFPIRRVACCPSPLAYAIVRQNDATMKTHGNPFHKSRRGPVPCASPRPPDQEFLLAGQRDKTARRNHRQPCDKALQV